jgi:hypothetical protein
MPKRSRLEKLLIKFIPKNKDKEFYMGYAVGYKIAYWVLFISLVILTITHHLVLI